MLPLRTPDKRRSGFTLIELMVAVTILMILATMALPIARVKIKRDKEVQLRRALRDMRSAIDRYKDAADRNLIAVEAETEGYPPTLDTLVEGVPLSGKPDRIVRFLRRVPIDPMTNSANWGLRAVQDPPDSFSWNGRNVFDVYSRSSGVGMNGRPYREW
jgi:general secretion pathway protein G